MNPEFSLITVTYNAGSTLQRTLQSAASQTFRRFEHLIVDGGSTDSTLALAQAYQQQNPDISVGISSEPDRGLYDAMNKGITRARGKYIVFLNAGDKLHAPQTLESLAALIPPDNGNKLPGVLYGETDLVDDAGNFLRHRRLQAPEQLSWKSFRQGMLVCHQSFYALREIVPSYDLQYRFSADVDWCIRVMKRAKEMSLPLVNSHLVLTDYLSEGMTTQHHQESLRERFQVMRKHYGLATTLAMHAWFALRAKIKP